MKSLPHGVIRFSSRTEWAEVMDALDVGGVSGNIDQFPLEGYFVETSSGRLFSVGHPPDEEPTNNEVTPAQIAQLIHRSVKPLPDEWTVGPVSQDPDGHMWAMRPAWFTLVRNRNGRLTCYTITVDEHLL